MCQPTYTTNTKTMGYAIPNNYFTFALAKFCISMVHVNAVADKDAPEHYILDWRE